MKTRVDQLLVERGLAESRTKAQALLLAGRVYSNERRIDKPGTQLDAEAPLSVRAGPQFVSRGGVKLDGALNDLEVDVTDAICVDLGASTGGFTDCLLQRGGRKVYAVDVGKGQLDTRLAADPRVVVRDGVNARHLDGSAFGEPIDLVTADLSFIGISKVVPAIVRILRPGGRLVALVKPQFEVGRKTASRSKGVIRDAEARRAAIDAALEAIESAGLAVERHVDSRLAGPKGNLEHFVLAARR